MSRIRLFLVWLVMAAVPLQGWAGASMLLCVAHPRDATPPIVQHDHTSTAGSFDRHDHSGHHDSPLTTVEKAVGDDSTSLSDATHQCGLCASCCHSVAIPETQHQVALAAVPQADAALPFVMVHARPAAVPDKPPRA